MIQRHFDPAARRRGSSLVVALVVVSALIILCAGFTTMSLSSQSGLQSKSDDEAALLLAEAGVTEAIVAMRAGQSGNVGREDLPAALGNGLVWVEATDLGDGTFRLVSTGMEGRGRAALEVVVSRSSPASFPFSVACDSDLELNSDALIDSFDSTLGTYDAQLGAGSFVGEDAVLDGNGYLKLKAGSIVHGDMHPGPADTVIFGGGSCTGSTTPSLDPFVIPPIAMPAIPPTGSLNIVANGSMTLPPGDYSFVDLKIEAGGTLTLEGPSTLVVQNQFEAKAGSEMIFGDVNEPVDIYVAGTMSMGDGAILTTPALDPSVVSMYLLGTDQNATINANGKYYGTIYGPDAYLQLKASIELMGALAVRRLKMDDSSKVHYDVALAGGGGAGGGSVEVVSWAPIGLTETEYLTNRKDPFALLNVERANLPKPADAWDL